MIERMHRHDAIRAALANEDCCNRMINRVRRVNRKPPSSGTDRITRVTVKNRGRIEPAATRRVEEPSPVVKRGPAPRLIAHPSPAKRGIHVPLPIGEGGPAEAYSKRPPAIAIGTTGVKSAIGVEIGESGDVIRGTSILQRRGGGGGDGVDATGDPAIKVVLLG
jgi:hypothetical protein